MQNKETTSDSEMLKMEYLRAALANMEWVSMPAPPPDEAGICAPSLAHDQSDSSVPQIFFRAAEVTPGGSFKLDIGISSKSSIHSTDLLLQFYKVDLSVSNDTHVHLSEPIGECVNMSLVSLWSWPEAPCCSCAAIREAFR